MKQKLLLLAALLIGQIVYAQYNYPASKTVDSADTYWGKTIADPYRWLEDIKNSEVVNWFKTQADYTNTQLAKIPNQNKLIQEMKDLDKLESASYTPVAKAGGKYFYKKKLPGEQTAKLYYRLGATGKETLLFDPQKFIAGKTMDYYEDVSDDGSKVILNLFEAGTELGDVRVIDVVTGKFLPDVIPHSGGGFVGGSNNEILYGEAKNYDVHDTANSFNTPCKLHVLGTPTASDIVIASSTKNPDIISPIVYPNVQVFKSSPYIFLNPSSVESNLTLYYAPKSELKSEKIHWKSLTVKEDEVRKYFVQGSDIYFVTSKGNPKFKIIKTSLEKPDLKTAKTIVEGSSDWQISNQVSQTKDYLVFAKSKNELIVKSVAYEFKTGKLTDINVPLNGNIYSCYEDFYQMTNREDNEVALLNTGWTTPLNFYVYNVQSKKLSTEIFTTKFNYPNLENLTYEEVEVPSQDGTLVPLSIVYDKTKLKKDGSNITFMRGYGAYGYSSPPAFSASLGLPLLNRGVILAIAHVRGGGEKGNNWYLGGKKNSKPNTWKDFNACAEWLIKNKYTSSEKLGATAASAGGILIGRAITERPDLYKVAIPKVGWLNMTRTEFSPNGPPNIPEFGTVKDSVEFKALLEMDAYLHIQKGVKYPAQLITTGWNDPRVDSYLPAKFAAKMQVNNGSNYPVFLDVNYKGGHFGGTTVDEQYAQRAKEYAFLLWQCGSAAFQP